MPLNCRASQVPIQHWMSTKESFRRLLDRSIGSQFEWDWGSSWESAGVWARPRSKCSLGRHTSVGRFRHLFKCDNEWYSIVCRLRRQQNCQVNRNVHLQSRWQSSRGELVTASARAESIRLAARQSSPKKWYNFMFYWLSLPNISWTAPEQYRRNTLETLSTAFLYITGDNSNIETSSDIPRQWLIALKI